MPCTHDGIYFCCVLCMCPGLSQYGFKIKYLPKKVIFLTAFFLKLAGDVGSIHVIIPSFNLEYTRCKFPAIHP